MSLDGDFDRSCRIANKEPLRRRLVEKPIVMGAVIIMTDVSLGSLSDWLVFRRRIGGWL
jgi:hypothetical protein